jgi:hypothetical protein
MAGANSKISQYVVEAVIVFVDTLVLRWQRMEFERQQQETAIGSARPSIDINDEVLVFDERALRLPNSVSSYSVFIPGARFAGQWALGLRATKVIS